MPFDGSSTSAILNISEVQCKDDGQYRCIVEYSPSDSEAITISTNTSVYIQGKKKLYYNSLYSLSSPCLVFYYFELLNVVNDFY